MTKTLTEKWKDGELNGGYYYVLLYGEKYPMIDHTKYNLLSHKIEWETFDSNAVESVVEEVPSYEEYQALLSDQLAKKEADEINAELLHKIEELEKQVKMIELKGTVK